MESEGSPTPTPPWVTSSSTSAPGEGRGRLGISSLAPSPHLTPLRPPPPSPGESLHPAWDSGPWGCPESMAERLAPFHPTPSVNGSWGQTRCRVNQLGRSVDGAGSVGSPPAGPLWVRLAAHGAARSLDQGARMWVSLQRVWLCLGLGGGGDLAMTPAQAPGPPPWWSRGTGPIPSLDQRLGSGLEGQAQPAGGDVGPPGPFCLVCRRGRGEAGGTGRMPCPPSTHRRVLLLGSKLDEPGRKSARPPS